ncbi:MAG: hypothetical protein EP338_01150 [Bacteroidetes bacterium]|nr:MAG: hypothetical protein EP338_01150 [Bacteroidota bacterium]
MKKRIVGLFLGVLASFALNAQYYSEDFIPRDAMTVLSINNVNLLKKVPMDDLVKYDFMAEVQSELFDGSTSGKTLKDSGIDFDQKFNAFFGENQKYEISGFTFGVKDKASLFQVFDDFDRQESYIPGVEIYALYYNYLIIKGNVAVVLRVDPAYEHLSSMADSIWFARGNGYYYGDGVEQWDELIEEEVPVNDEVVEDEIFEEDFTDSTGIEDPAMIEGKTYWEMKDSLSVELRMNYFKNILCDLYESNINLRGEDENLASQLNHPSDGIFYLDNSRGFRNATGMWHFKRMFPELYSDIKEIYTGNVMLGDIELNESSIDIRFQANYGEALGSIYEKLNGARFDKNVLKYIHQNSTGFFTYNINLKEGYNQAYDIIIPILSKEDDPRISSSVLMAELVNEFVNTDAIFETYKGSMFGSFNGIRKVKTRKIEFYYDEETFEYEEREIDGEEEMPVFTLGFSTDRGNIPEKVLNHLARITPKFKKMENYWVVEDAIYNSVPLYIINENNLLIFTNDADLALHHHDGYGSSSLKGKKAKAARKSKFMYAYFDWGQALNSLPREIFNQKQNEILDAMRGKTGLIELESSKTSREKTSFHLSYKYQGDYDNSGRYLLDLVNSIYVLSK